MQLLNLLLWCAATVALPLDISGPTHPGPSPTLGRVLHLKSMTTPRRNTRFKGRLSSSLFDYGVNTLWLTQVTLGSQDLWVEIDTGSSEFWVASTGYTCVADYNCEMASTYTPRSFIYSNSRSELQFHVRGRDFRERNTWLQPSDFRGNKCPSPGNLRCSAGKAHQTQADVIQYS